MSTTNARPQSPYASPNAIPPRTSSSGIFNGLRARPSVLRPLSEVDWLSQSKKSKLYHTPAEHNRSSSAYSHTMMPKQQQQQQRQPPSSLPPPKDAAKSIGNDLIFRRRSTWTDEKEGILLAPYNYLLGHPGKDIRSQCIAAFNEWLKVPPERLEVITRVVGMLHTSSLLVDDVQDSSVLRRGIPVAHSIFGVAQTINAANYVYFEALQELLAMGNSKLIQIFTEELLNLHRGQGMELHWRDSLTCPSEAEYLEMVDNKTGGLFRLAIKLMQAESAIDIDCAPLVSTIGLLFQILDDHLNLVLTSPYTALKGLCEDLTEGKFSFPVLYAIHADPANRVLYNILKQKTTDEEVKRYAVRYMEEKGSFEYSRGVIEGLKGRAGELIGVLERVVGGSEGARGAEGLRRMLARLVLK